MKFAVSSAICPEWDFLTIAERAKEYGYDGVELHGSRDPSLSTASDVFLTDPAKIRAMFKAVGIEVCCLSGSIAYPSKTVGGAARAKQLQDYIDTAQAIACPWVKFGGPEGRPGAGQSTIGVEMGDWLLSLGDYAAERGVGILLENSLLFRTAKEMWAILDRLHHPSIACCWDIFNAAMAGQSPAMSVPVLNSKIQYADVKDAVFGSSGVSYRKLGLGDVQVEKFIKRLRGIGFEGFVAVDWEPGSLPKESTPEEILSDSIAKLRRWDKKLEISDAESEALAR